MIADEITGIELIEDLISSPCGLMFDKIPEQPGKQKTPDFRVISWRGLSAYLS